MKNLTERFIRCILFPVSTVAGALFSTIVIIGSSTLAVLLLALGLFINKFHYRQGDTDVLSHK